MDYMTNLVACELRPLDAMNNSRLRMIRTIHGDEPLILNAMNSLGLWMI